MRHGVGTAIDADGSIYHGEFMDNMRYVHLYLYL
jgi:hypothetical protein